MFYRKEIFRWLTPYRESFKDSYLSVAVEVGVGGSASAESAGKRRGPSPEADPKSWRPLSLCSGRRVLPMVLARSATEKATSATDVLMAWSWFEVLDSGGVGTEMN